MYCVGTGNRIENTRATIIGLDLNFNFHSSKLYSFKNCGAHFIFAVNGVFSKDLEPMLCKRHLVRYLFIQFKKSLVNLTHRLIV